MAARICLIVTLFSLAITGVSQAGLVYSFATDQANYNVAPGGSVSVPAYLAETVTTPDTSFLVSEGGLHSAGVLIQRTGTSTGVPVMITALAANTGAFNDTPATVDVTADQASVFELRLLEEFAGVEPTETFAGSGVWRVLLGTVTFTAGSNPGEVTTFQLTDNVTDDTTTWATFTLLDSQINSGAVTVTVTPEPATLAILAMGGVALCVRRRRHAQGRTDSLRMRTAGPASSDPAGMGS